MRVLVTRPEPGASASAARLAALGHTAIVAPLLAVEPRRWSRPAAMPDALIITSANAVRHGGSGLDALRGVPVWAVGAATAAAARAAGFSVAWTGDAGVAGLAAATAGLALRMLHLAGEDRLPAAWPPGVSVDVVTVYAAVPAAALAGDVAAMLAADPAGIDRVLLYSPRTAAVFAALCDRHGIDRSALAIAALGPRVLAAAGSGWRAAIAAAAPDEASLFAAASLSARRQAADAGPGAGLTSAPDGVQRRDGAAD